MRKQRLVISLPSDVIETLRRAARHHLFRSAAQMVAVCACALARACEGAEEEGSIEQEVKEMFEEYAEAQPTPWRTAPHKRSVKRTLG